MWCTTFAPTWHSAVEFKRYLVRFAHMVAGFDRCKSLRTVYNPVDHWVRGAAAEMLDERGVHFEFNTRVADLR